MVASAEFWWSTLATSLALALAGAGFAAAARRGRYPRLDEPDPDCKPTGADRVRYYGANLLALLLGTVPAAVLFLWVPAAEPGVLFRTMVYDHPAARAIGPFFVMLAVGAMVAYPLAARLVRAGPLQHFLWRSSAQFGRADPRPATKWMGRIVGPLAVIAHFGMQLEHTTFDAAGVRWRAWPWQEEQSRAWTDVRDVRIVRLWVAASGNPVERPHLGLEFHDGEVLHLGGWNDAPAGTWEAPAAIAAERAGVALRRVERDD